MAPVRRFERWVRPAFWWPRGIRRRPSSSSTTFLPAHSANSGLLKTSFFSLMHQPHQSEPVKSISYSVTQVKQPDGSWLIASSRDHLEVTAPSEHLKPLVWLAGEWTYEGDDGVRMQLAIDLEVVEREQRQLHDGGDPHRSGSGASGLWVRCQP